MSLIHIDIRQLRNLRHVSLELDPHLNLIVGPNASGKTSLLEAVYFLGRARSFRTSRNRELITDGETDLTVTGRVSFSGVEHRLGIGLQGAERRIRIDGKEVDSRAELLAVFPVRIVDPSCYSLLEAAPQVRRRFLDWGVFYFDSGYLPAWRAYRRTLQQRNAALKAGERQGARLWGRELAKYGKIVDYCRRRYLEAFGPELRTLGKQLGLGTELELRYLPGWAGDKDLEVVLEDDLDRDLPCGCTHNGPHRADFAVYADGHSVRQRFSRGQMKLLVHALIVVQGQLLQHPDTLLIDDLASELDLENQALLSELVVQIPAQVFVTATRPEALTKLRPYRHRMFHVEHGHVTPV